MFEPDERYEVELQGQDYILLRERDIHAVATNDSGEESAGLYL
jgi:chaperonin GroES